MKPFSWSLFFSIFGSYCSVVGLIVMFNQFKSVRATTEETKNRISGISLISEWSKATEIIRAVETDIERDAYSVASFKLMMTKDIIIKTVGYLKNNEDGFKEYDKILRRLNSFIDLLNQSILKEEFNDINKLDIVTGLETVVDFLNRKIYKHSNIIQ